MITYIVHRWDGTPKSDWYKWLKERIEKNLNIKVVIPRMPESHKPEIKKWTSKLKDMIEKSDEEVFFIGHSVGCQTVLRSLPLLKKNIKIKGIILVAAWLKLSNLEDKKTEEIAKPWIETPINFSYVKNKVKNITIFLSDNDKYVNYKENMELFKKNINFKIIIGKNKGHFTEHDGVREVPEVLNEFLRMCN